MLAMFIKTPQMKGGKICKSLCIGMKDETSVTYRRVTQKAAVLKEN